MSDRPSETRPLPAANDVWRHWSGQLVRVVALATDDFGRELVVYEPVGGGPAVATTRARWRRDATLQGGVVVPNFELVAAFADRPDPPDPPDDNPVGPTAEQRSHH